VEVVVDGDDSERTLRGTFAVHVVSGGRDFG
jgi:hypothetical protein